MVGTKYYLFDARTKDWDERRKQYEIMCDQFLSKNASFEEHIEFLKKHHAKNIKVVLWDDKDEEEYNEYKIYKSMGYFPSEIYSLMQEWKRTIKKNKKFIDKYPILNATPPE